MLSTAPTPIKKSLKVAADQLHMMDGAYLYPCGLWW